VASITRQVVRLLGHKGAARYFTWQLVPLDATEQAALPPPARGHRRPTHRLDFRYDAAAAQADEAHDGLAVLVTTAAVTQSADLLFSHFIKQKNDVEMLHHQWKTPLAVSPVFLKSPRRVEAWPVCCKSPCRSSRSWSGCIARAPRRTRPSATNG
jgi:hypothetical protein